MSLAEWLMAAGMLLLAFVIVGASYLAGRWSR